MGTGDGRRHADPAKGTEPAAGRDAMGVDTRSAAAPSFAAPLPHHGVQQAPGLPPDWAGAAVQTAGVLAFQQGFGNRFVQRLVAPSVQRVPKRGLAPKSKSSAELKAEFVTAEVAKGNFKGVSPPLSPGVMGPPAPGGAFWMLNGLNPDDMIAVLRLCGKATRGALLAHIADADGLFDRPRLESALRSSAWGEDASGVAGLTLLDAVRTAGTGPFAPVWAQLAGKSRVKVIAALRTLPRATLTLLQTKLPDAPAADRPMFTEVVADLLGSGTDMQATDTIDLQGLKGLRRVMAGIYNLRGQIIEERAKALGIPTHAAAGIMKVESGGATFAESTDKSVIRFENHVFWNEWGRANAAAFNAHFDFKRTGGKPFTGHRFRAGTSGAWESCHQDQAQERRVMEFAATLSGKEPAYRSASWGAGQIMGFNAARVGFATAEAMAAEFDKAERPQVAGIFEFIRSGRLAPAINRGDYLTLAKGYNGTGQAATYEAHIRDAADAYRAVTAGKKHVIP